MDGIVKDVLGGDGILQLRHVFALVHIVDIAGPTRSAVPGKVPFLPAFEAGSLLSWRRVFGLCRISLHSVVGLCHIPSRPWVIPSLLISAIRRGPESRGGVHQYQRVVQPSGGVGGVVLSLRVLVLIPGQRVSPLEERPVSWRLKAVVPPWCVPLYRIYQLL